MQAAQSWVDGLAESHSLDRLAENRVAIHLSNRDTDEYVTMVVDDSGKIGFTIGPVGREDPVVSLSKRTAVGWSGKTLGELVQSGALLRSIVVPPGEELHRFYYQNLPQLAASVETVPPLP